VGLAGTVEFEELVDDEREEVRRLKGRRDFDDNIDKVVELEQAVDSLGGYLGGALSLNEEEDGQEGILAWCLRTNVFGNRRLFREKIILLRIE